MRSVWLCMISFEWSEKFIFSELGAHISWNVCEIARLFLNF